LADAVGAMLDAAELSQDPPEDVRVLGKILPVT
jgi:hypothetical protein